MNPPSKPRFTSAGTLRRVALLVFTALVSLAAGILLEIVWLSLPPVQLSRIDLARFNAAFRAAQRQMAVEPRDALIAANLSNLVTASLVDPESLWTNRTTAEDMATALRRTQLGRLHQTALMMRELGVLGVPPQDWWTSVKPILTGLERANFTHSLPALIKDRTEVLEGLGIAPGTARVYARQTIGHPHGPFLQFLDRELQRLAAATLSKGNADAVHRITQVRRRLLRQWVTEPGPAALRLLAADLLAADLEATLADDPPNPDTRPALAPPNLDGAQAHHLATDLRNWREAYRAAAAARPLPVALVSLSQREDSVPELHEREITLTALLLWTAPAPLLAALLALVLLARRPKKALTDRWPVGGAVAGLSGAAIVLLSGTVLRNAAPDRFLDASRMLIDPQLGWPWWLLWSATIPLACVLMAVIFGSGGRHLRLLSTAVWCWLPLVLVLAVSAEWARQTLNTRQVRTAATLAAGDYAAIAGPAAETLLDRVRAWEP